MFLRECAAHYDRLKHVYTRQLHMDFQGLFISQEDMLMIPVENHHNYVSVEVVIGGSCDDTGVNQFGEMK